VRIERYTFTAQREVPPLDLVAASEKRKALLEMTAGGLMADQG
jgi:hypothetical protein